jgi:NAD(P)-dependent dehydrogenase (short-subunit alcohol dehydrogenase family)
MDASTYNPDTAIPTLTGKVILVTGGESLFPLHSCVRLIYDPVGTSGIGAETVLQIAKHNPRALYFTGRNADSAASVIQRAKTVAPSVKVTFIHNDLSSLNSVNTTANQFLIEEDRLDVLLCNAGVAMSPPALTTDGYERLFGTNFVGHALLIKKLLPALQRTAAAPGSDVRIIILSSQILNFAPSGGIDFTALRSDKEMGFLVGPYKRYGQSKLASTIYARELARRYPEITTVSLHPGIVNTPMNNKGQGWLTHKLFLLFGPLKPEQGAYNSLWASFAPKSSVVSGQMYNPVGKPFNLPKSAKDEALGSKLWEWTQKELEKF